MVIFMEIEIKISSPEPVYKQIVRQISEAVQTGGVKGGYSLPPVRQLAGDLMINSNTVAKAYKQLEQMRVVRGAGRAGTFVEENAAAHIAQNNSVSAKIELDGLLKSFVDRGIPGPEVRILLFDSIEKLRG